MTVATLRQRLFPNEPFHYGEFQKAVRTRVFPSCVLLDLGCGNNATFDDLRSQGMHVWGADFETHPHLRCPEHFRLLQADGTLPFADQSFDLVACLWVLEHVQQPARFLREVHRVLRPGGHFIGHSIHGWHYVTWIRRLFQLLPHRCSQVLVRRLYGRAEHDTFPTCYRMNTATQLRTQAQQSGLAYRDIRYYADHGYFSFHPWAARGAIVLDWLLERAFGCGRLYFTVQMQRPALEAQTSPVLRQAG